MKPESVWWSVYSQERMYPGCRGSERCSFWRKKTHPQSITLFTVNSATDGSGGKTWCFLSICQSVSPWFCKTDRPYSDWYIPLSTDSIHPFLRRKLRDVTLAQAVSDSLSGSSTKNVSADRECVWLSVWLSIWLQSFFFRPGFHICITFFLSCHVHSLFVLFRPFLSVGLNLAWVSHGHYSVSMIWVFFLIEK